MKMLSCCSLMALLGLAAPVSQASVLDDLLPAPISIVKTDKAPVPVTKLSEVRVEKGTVPGAPERVASEGYRLEIGADGVKMTVSGERGERHAKTTLAQIAALVGAGGTAQ